MTQPEISVVIPCLDEAETVGACIEKALAGIAESGASGEVILADNGSVDGSREIAERLGARVVPVAERGYGNALQGGISAARGRFVVMGDADDSYDFREIPRFLPALRQGHTLVMGCRLPSGGGAILPGAMPLLHRVWGNPMFSAMARLLFRYPGHDVYCGLRAFDRGLVDRLKVSSPGMEFAVEMVLKSSLFGERISEVPITLHPDGRTTRAPHLRTFRDGWRTLRLFLAFSPKWLFMLPALALVAFGLLGYAIALPGLTLFGATFDVHTLLIASLSLLLGMQMAFFAIATHVGASQAQLIPPSKRVVAILEALRLERVLIASSVAILVGLAVIVKLSVAWTQSEFGPLDYRQTMRSLIPSVTLIAVGVQAFMGGFFLAALYSPTRAKG